MATYVNDLRLKEIATGDESGTWGTSTNTNLELIADAFSYATKDCFASDADATETMADGVADEIRSLYLKVTSSATLTATRTLTLAPNTVSKTWIIENATTGGQSISISQGSGANVTIPNGDTKIIYTDGAGAGAAVTDAFANLKVTDPAQTNITSVGTLTGLDVAGTATMDALTVEATSDGSGITAGLVSGQNVEIGLDRWTGSGSNFHQWQLYTDVDDLQIKNVSNNIKGTAFTSRVNFAANGDISFYDDTGTSQALFWDASAESLGIGTTSPSAKLHSFVGASAVTGIYANNANDAASTGVLIHADSLRGDTSAYTLFKASNSVGTKMIVQGDGNVGIGTDSPGAKLHVQTSGGNLGAIRTDNPTVSDGTGMYLRTTGQAAISWGTGGFLGFYGNGPGNSERLRIDSSGNVLVGATSDLTDAYLQAGGVGIALRSNKTLAVSRSGATVAQFNRNTSDGEIVAIRKDGTTVGSIGTLSSDIVIGSRNDVGFKIYAPNSDGTSSTIHPIKPVNTAAIDAKMDLGYSGGRFKDLYLSGSISTNSTGGLSITSDSTNRGILNLSTSTAYQLIGGSYYGYTGYKTGGYHRFFGSDGGEDMRIDSSGNLLVGGTTTTAIPALDKGIHLLSSTNGDVIGYSLYANEGTNNRRASFFLDDTNGVYGFDTTASSGVCNFVVNSAGTERMRIDSSGNLLVGTTGIPTGGASTGFSISNNGGFQMVTHGVSGTGNTYVNIYKNANGTVGGIRVNGSSTAYDTASDYRLKENVVTDWDATTRLKQLRPSRFNFIADADTTVDGFLAHEVQDIVPEAISGVKDAVDDEGNPVYQGIDQSKLVPLLVKTIQELEARITALES